LGTEKGEQNPREGGVVRGGICNRFFNDRRKVGKREAVGKGTPQGEGFQGNNNL